VAALAADPCVIERTGQLFASWELARAYGFTDYDGRVPDWGALTVDFSMLPSFIPRDVQDRHAAAARVVAHIVCAHRGVPRHIAASQVRLSAN
jgi:hypothetical protein